MAGAVVDLEEALLVLERQLACRVAFTRQQHGKQAVACAVAGVHGLYHGAKVGLDAGGERSTDAQCDFGLLDG